MIPLVCCMSRRKDGFTMTYSEKNRVFFKRWIRNSVEYETLNLKYLLDIWEENNQKYHFGGSKKYLTE